MFSGIEEEMPYGNPKFDFIVKNGIKIDIKSCSIRENEGWYGWELDLNHRLFRDSSYRQ